MNQTQSTVRFRFNNSTGIDHRFRRSEQGIPYIRIIQFQVNGRLFELSPFEPVVTEYRAMRSVLKFLNRHLTADDCLILGLDKNWIGCVFGVLLGKRNAIESLSFRNKGIYELTFGINHEHFHG